MVIPHASAGVFARAFLVTETGILPKKL